MRKVDRCALRLASGKEKKAQPVKCNELVCSSAGPKRTAR